MVKYLNMKHIDLLSSIDKGKEYLWKFFVNEKGQVSFYGSLELENYVGLGEIVPNGPEYKFLVVTGKGYDKLSFATNKANQFF